MGAGLMVLGSLAPVARAEESLIFPNVSEPAFTSTCFLELESNGKSLGRVEVSVSAPSRGVVSSTSGCLQVLHSP